MPKKCWQIKLEHCLKSRSVCVTPSSPFCTSKSQPRAYLTLRSATKTAELKTTHGVSFIIFRARRTDRKVDPVIAEREGDELAPSSRCIPGPTASHLGDSGNRENLGSQKHSVNDLQEQLRAPVPFSRFLVTPNQPELSS